MHMNIFTLFKMLFSRMSIYFTYNSFSELGKYKLVNKKKLKKL